MRGGSRYGAGRPGWKGKTGQKLQIDVRKMARDGLLVAGKFFSWVWWNDAGERTSSIGVRVTGNNSISLKYTITGQAGNPDQCINLPIRLDRTACNYGGSRVWFSCPQCSTRVGILYLTHGTWRCRHCSKLAYTSQSEDVTSRLWRKQRKIERRLAGSAGEWNGWRKPKGMHQITFDRLRAAIAEIERAKDQAFMMMAMQFFGPARFAAIVGAN